MEGETPRRETLGFSIHHLGHLNPEELEQDPRIGTYMRSLRLIGYSQMLRSSRTAVLGPGDFAMCATCGRVLRGPAMGKLIDFLVEHFVCGNCTLKETYTELLREGVEGWNRAREAADDTARQLWTDLLPPRSEGGEER